MNKIEIVKAPVHIGGVLFGYDLGILIDGETPSRNVFDPIEFIASTFKLQKSYMFTCSCGIPGCVGIDRGIHIKQRRHTVEWRNMDVPTRTTQRFYSFDKNEYKAAQAKCMGLMYEIVRENEAIRKEVLMAGDPDNRFDWDGPTFCEIYSDSQLLAAIKYRQEWIEDYCLL